MPIGLKEKQAIVAEVNETASKALSAVMADYRGVTVEKMTLLRKQAREAGVHVRVIRNTLAKRAIQGTDFECMQDVLLGPNVLAFSIDDPGAAARVFKEFAKNNDAFEIKALSVGGKMLAADQIDALAKLPTREEALALLMSVMLAPVAKLTRTLNDIPGRVTRVVAAVRDQKQEAVN
ncbi:MAG: 50S ribosomal protein L10 [Proteobacteria bacterium]|nr:50S ribosomal protein L10 [Pseudomonadota bacterium]MDA1298448.1 50S ribosomal protein L10 [Pseudomonadota bacterium]